MTRVIDADGIEIHPDWVGLFSLLSQETQGEIAWQRDARCRTVKVGRTVQSRVHAFFPDRGRPAERAKAICAECPVWRECLEYALENHLRDGVFGGTTEKERRVILRARRLGLDLEISPPQGRKPKSPRCDCPDCQYLARKMGAVA